MQKMNLLKDTRGYWDETFMKTVSIVIPAYNEEKYISILLERILQVPIEEIGFLKQIIVIDDGSSDDTAECVKAFSGVQILQQANQGKGAAVQLGVKNATGDYILVQDADLEYDPLDYMSMLRELDRNDKVVIYGSRLLGQLHTKGWTWPFPGKHTNQGLGPWVMNHLLSIIYYILFRVWITDTLTGYKIYPAKLVKSFDVKSCGFETDHELTCKLLNAGADIVEVPISYEPRSRQEGKKIRFRDGLIALWIVVKYRFSK